MAFSVLGFSVPVFVVAYALIIVFSVQLEWLPVQGYRPLREGVWQWFRHLVLPSLALGTGGCDASASNIASTRRGRNSATAFKTPT